VLIAGVDDAGRGSVIGPLTIAGVSMREERLPMLIQLGARDSKLLSPRRREVLAVEIKRLSYNYHIEKLTPKQIDDVVFNGRRLFKLNRLEAQTMAKVINALKPDIVYVDASDVNEQRFKEHILEGLTQKTSIVSEHKADRNYPVVGAASILAKVERDEEIEKLKDIYGDFGSGYPSDPRTVRFLEECAQKWTEYPEFVRKSWKPAKKVRSRHDQCQAKLTRCE
jgi:ribonuclease HII